ncbi:MAG: A/G-specific adenine glycosylase, partial [Actinomycetota bacterium]
VIPRDVDALRRLPGVGPYTAAAVASLGFGTPFPALDTNVRRVVGRAILGRDDAPPGEVHEAADRWLDRRDPGSWNQALMDVGRMHCGTRPRCDGCPLSGVCAFRRSGAIPSPPRRRQPRYQGSMRQLRGAILRALRSTPSVSMEALIESTGRDADEVVRAVTAMDEEGLIVADRTAPLPAPHGLVRLSH